MYSGRRKDHWHRHFILVRLVISQNDMSSARAHRIFRFSPNAVQCRLQTARVASNWERTINLDHIGVKLFFQLLELRIRNKRAVQN